MKKIILKYWIFNVLISIVLFYGYVFVIKQTESKDGNWFETIFEILLIILEFYFATVFLATMVVCSLTYFLNLIEKIRKNHFYSFLTFLGLPITCTIFLLINVLIDIRSNSESILKPILILSIIYFLVVIIEFLLFRKILENSDENK